jgi:hypothetical protein
MKRYRKRLKRCSGHSRCITTTQKSPPNLAPTRLLHIGMYQDMDVRLRIIKPENPLNYVALSYCWGDSQEKATTTKINIKARLKEVDWSQLPQTIKDAVKVTQSLGFTYLWVDALCIIQDDKQDVATELAKMSSIYQGASLTISAASAKHSSEGFLGDRVLSKAYGDALFRLPYRHGKGGNIVKGEVLLSKQPIRDTFEDPIDQRAWTWQEHILSRRLLRFGSRQTTWKCQNSHCSIDGGGLPQPVNKDVQFAIDKIHESKEVQLKMNEFGQLGHSIVLSNWNIQIEEYSRRTITDLNDKIPACAALAENFAGIMRLSAADYLAGLWKNDIEAQLLWHRPDNSGVSNSRRSQNPTWSWASLDGPVTFFQRSLLETSGRIIDAQAKLEGYEITREVKSLSYSEVSSDHLRLRGRLQQAHWDGFDLRQSTGSFEVIDLRIYWDSSISNCHRDVWCFEVFGSTYSLGLILKKIPKGFERLGFFQVDSQSSCTAVKSWFREVEKEQIFLY